MLLEQPCFAAKYTIPVADTEISSPSTPACTSVRSTVPDAGFRVTNAPPAVTATMPGGVAPLWVAAGEAVAVCAVVFAGCLPAPPLPLQADSTLAADKTATHRTAVDPAHLRSPGRCLIGGSLIRRLRLHWLRGIARQALKVADSRCRTKDSAPTLRRDSNGRSCSLALAPRARQ